MPTVPHPRPGPLWTLRDAGPGRRGCLHSEATSCSGSQWGLAGVRDVNFIDQLGALVPLRPLSLPPQVAPTVPHTCVPEDVTLETVTYVCFNIPWVFPFVQPPTQPQPSHQVRPKAGKRARWLCPEA